MALRNHLSDREKDKFTLTTDDETAVRVVICDSDDEGDSLVVISPELPSGYSQYYEYNEVTSVSVSATVNLFSYTVPVLNYLFLDSLEFSSTGLGMFEFKINGILKQKCRSYYTDYNPKIDFALRPIKLVPGDVVLVTVTNYSLVIADYNISVKGLLK